MASKYTGAILLVMAASNSASAATSAPDKLTSFFEWWNGAYPTPGAYTVEAFRRYVTDDVTMVINGEAVVSGIDNWARHFTKLQSTGVVVSVVLPLRRVERIGDTIYTYNIMRGSRASTDGCMLSSGYATVRDEKISSLVLVRVPADPAKEADCAKK